MTPTPPTKLGIAIDLDELELLVQNYLQENADGEYDLYHQVLFSHFLQWSAQRQNERKDDE